MPLSARASLQLILSLIFIFIAANSYAQESVSDDWDPASAIPNVLFLGAANEIELADAQQLRRELINNLSYWKELGLSNPPELDAIIKVNDPFSVTLRQLVAVMNPDIDDIVAFVMREYKVLAESAAAQAILRLERDGLLRRLVSPQKIQESGGAINWVFDQFILRRLGFSVPNFIDAFRKNLPIAKLPKVFPSAQILFEADNAYFSQGGFPNLSDLLRAESEDDKRRNKVNVRILTNMSLASAYLKNPKQYFRRLIVLLPRTGEEHIGPEVSSIRDSSVVEHEFGHHIVHAQGEHGYVHRIIDEVLADYLALAPHNEPELGKFFAEASGIIADSLLELKLPVQAKMMAMRLKEISDQGYLRSFAKPSHILSLRRRHGIEDDYHMGDPLRFMLWSLRFAQGLDKKLVDKVVLSSIKPFAELPMSMSRRTQMLDALRQVESQIKTQYTANWALDKAKKKLLETYKDEINALAIRNVKTVEDVYGADDGLFHSGRLGLESESPEEGFSKSLKAEIRALQNEYIQQYRDEIRVMASQIARDQTEINDQKENEQRQRSNEWGFEFRPFITADYIIPEFVRVLYRTAHEIYPELKPHIARLSSEMMKSVSREVDLDNGQVDLHFSRTSYLAYNPMVFSKVRKLFRKKYALQQSIAEAVANPEQTDNKVLSEYLREYSRVIEKIGEHERTGFYFKLYFPHPVLAVMQLPVINELFVTILNQRSRVPGESELKVALNLDCEGVMQ